MKGSVSGGEVAFIVCDMLMTAGPLAAECLCLSFIVTKLAGCFAHEVSILVEVIKKTG